MQLNENNALVHEPGTTLLFHRFVSTRERARAHSKREGWCAKGVTHLHGNAHSQSNTTKLMKQINEFQDRMKGEEKLLHFQPNNK